MIEQQGQVHGVTGSTAQVRVGPLSGCPACDRGQGCGAGLFGRLLRRAPVIVACDNALGAKPGDAVRVGIPEQLLLRLVTRFYLIPLVGGLGGAALGHHLGLMALSRPGLIDGVALAGAVLGTALCLPRRRPGQDSLVAEAVRLIGPVTGRDAADCAAPDSRAAVRDGRDARLASRSKTRNIDEVNP